MLKNLLKTASTLATGAISGQLVVLMVSPILTRIYSPDAFGVFGGYVACLYILGCVSALKYDVAIPLVKSSRQANSLIALAVFINVIFSVLIFFIIFCVLALYPNKEYEFVLWALPLGLLLSGVYSVFMYYNLRLRKAGLIAKTRFIQSLSGAMAQVSLGYLMAGVSALVIGQIVSISAGGGRLMRASRLKNMRCYFSASLLWATARRYIDFAKYNSPSALLSVGNNHLPVILIGGLFSPAAAGVYVIVHRILITPLSIVSSSISSAILSFGADSSKMSFGRNVVLVFLCLSPLSVFAAVFGYHVFGYVFGAEWASGGQVVAWMMLFLSYKFMYDATFMLYAARNNLKEGLGTQIIVFVIRLGGLVVCSVFFDFDVSIFIFSISSSLTYLFLCFFGHAGRMFGFTGKDLLGLLADLVVAYVLIYFYIGSGVFSGFYLGVGVVSWWLMRILLVLRNGRGV
ncbi:lipopolysaccharide biosynthesis protein [Kerstersia similis]|uniref:lipopolysaccharide biosynthesis protein n=1 Tax=Kerstersia similis TaxID=206505 RepID=UPI0039EEDC7F